jgi:Tol biopolymer transport system component
MSKVDDELTRRLQRAERPLDGEQLFDELVARRSQRERLRRIQAVLVAVVVLAATAGGFATLREVFEPDGRGPAVSPSPSVPLSNGEIVFERDDAADGVTHLYAMRPDGTHPRQVTDFPTSDGAPAVSPDGATVAFVHELENLTPVIASIPIEGGTITRLTDDRLFASAPAWSPDGSRIAFAAHDGSGQRLFIVNADGSDVRPITDADRYWVTGGAWSPDGTRIGFTASLFDDKGELVSSDIFTVRPDGSDLVNVTQSPAAKDDEVGPTWSPDGKRIAFTKTSGRGRVLVVRNLAEGTERTITEGHVDESPAWSPDGTVIAFDRSPLEGGGFDVWLVRPDGSGLTRLTRDGGFNPAWQPLPVELEPSVTTSPEPEGSDIGLGFPMCNLERLDGIDWYGDGTLGAAWTGARVTDGGSCPANGVGEYIVAADLDGDGSAEPGGMGFLDHCLLCQPVAATDLSGDGVLELVVLEEASSTPSYSLYEVSLPTSERSPGIYSLFVAPPGYPAGGFPGGEPIRFTAGGDEGYSAAIDCEGYPDAPVLVVAWSNYQVEVDETEDVYVTRLRLGDDGAFHVIGGEHSTQAIDDPLPVDPAPTACGVAFDPFA